jgi:predicted ABC-type ATPase
MTDRPQLWMLVGGNGSGKTSFYLKFLQPHGIHFINADLIARDISPDNPEAVSYEAAQIAEQIRLDLLHQGISFCFENGSRILQRVAMGKLGFTGQLERVRHQSSMNKV